LSASVLHRDDDDLKIELINDVPSRIGPVLVHPVLGSGQR